MATRSLECAKVHVYIYCHIMVVSWFISIYCVRAAYILPRVIHM